MQTVKIILDALTTLPLLAITGMVMFELAKLLGDRDYAEEFIDAEFKPLDNPIPPPCARRSYGWQNSPSRAIASQTFMEGLPVELKRVLRRNAEELKKVQKWHHYATHAKKRRTRKKYWNKLWEYYRIRPIPWYGLPSSMEFTSGPGYSSGQGLDSESPEVIWWCRRPGEFYPVGEDGSMKDWGPRPF